jgi:hypothetical protein
MMGTTYSLTNLWDVLVLFLIPIGGGIPAGVVLAQKRAIAWPIMMVLYFISDVILACVFEPILLYFAGLSKRSPAMAKVRESLAKSTSHVVARYGLNPRPLSLVMITFGTDPMTGRAVALAAGHGFITGWALTIAGDMIFFTVIMASTLWLNDILGDGTLTAVIILVAMMVLPSLVRWVRKQVSTPA